jgi:hypothetical protein
MEAMGTPASGPAGMERLVAGMIHDRRRLAQRRLGVGFSALVVSLPTAALALLAMVTGSPNPDGWVWPALGVAVALAVLALLLLRGGLRRIERLNAHHLSAWTPTAMIMRRWCVQRRRFGAGGPGHATGEIWAALWLPAASDPHQRPVLLLRIVEDVPVERACHELGVSMERGFLAELGFRTSTLSQLEEVEVIGDPVPGSFVLIRGAKASYLPLEKTVSGRPDDWRGREFIPR